MAGEKDTAESIPLAGSGGALLSIALVPAVILGPSQLAGAVSDEAHGASLLFKLGAAVSSPLGEDANDTAV